MSALKGFVARHRDLLAPLAIVGAVCAMLLSRLQRQPMPRYGGGAAHYIEHAYRIERVTLWRSRSWDPMQFLVAADIPEGFPPMLHALHGLAGGVVGHSVQAQLVLGIGWLALLALSVGWVALRLSGRRDVAGAALAGVFLLPAAQGMALRFYYDLPAAAVLWLALAIFVAAQDRRPLLGGALSGALVWVAGCVKWSMLPYAALTFPFAVFARSPDRRLARRLVSLAIAGAVAAGFLWAWMDGGGGSHNETLASRSSSTGPWEERVRFLPMVLQAVAARGMWELTHPDLVKWLWYPLAGLVSILSPLWAAALAPLVWAGLRQRPRGVLLPVGSVLGIGAFLTFMLAVRDERFTIAAAGAVVLLAALGWGTLAGRRKVVLGWLAAVSGLLVAADFHFAPQAFWNRELTVYPGRMETYDDPGLPPLRLRGLGASDSVERRGWSRADTTPDTDLAYLEEVWASIERCGGPAVALSAHVLPNGSGAWLRYRAGLSHVRGDGWSPRIEVQWTMPGDEGDGSPQDAPAFRAHVGVAQLSGAGLPGEGWRLISRHSHPDTAELGETAAIGIFARPPATCLP